MKTDRKEPFTRLGGAHILKTGRSARKPVQDSRIVPVASCVVGTSWLNEVAIGTL